MGRQVTVRPGAPRGRARGENRARMERLERGLGRRGGPRPRSWSVAPGCLGRETGKRRARPREREREKGAVFAGAGAQQSAGSAGPRSGDSGAGRDSVSATLDAFVRFTRPHTVLGTAISVTSVSLLAARNTADFNLSLLSALATALCAALSANVSIVGLNQLYDVEIDRVNKPYLPLASGEFSAGQGAWIVGASGALGLGIALASGSKPVALTVAASLLLGVFYSADLPLLRWKRYPVLAATCILSVRAVIVQLGFFAHARRALALASGDQVAPLARDLGGSLGLVFGTGFMVLFSVAIALFKDLPDVEGDEGAGIRTLSVAFGQQFVFRACGALLTAAYATAILVGLFCCTHWWTRLVTVGCHAALGATLAARTRTCDLESPSSLYEFYMFIWKLFYAEYVLLPFIR